MSDLPDSAGLCRRLGYNFKRPELMQEALTHASYLQDNTAPSHNQRLEFLGDAVLHFALTDALYHEFPAEREGVLSRRRASLSRGGFLSQLAHELDIGPHLLMSKSELDAGGRRRASTLEDALEAIVGAIYLDSDIATATRVVLGWYGPLANRLVPLESQENPKGQLQEIVQPLHGNGALRYEVIEATGPRHAREYQVAVFLLDRELGTGRGTSKKAAEESAARAALATLRKDSPSA